MKGVLFTPDNIKATVEGRKVMTRRVMNPQPEELSGDYEWRVEGNELCAYKFHPEDLEVNAADEYLPCGIKPRYQVGEIVYIKEAWATYRANDDWTIPMIPDTATIFYKLDGDKYGHTGHIGKWRSPLFLKEIFARYFIKITDVGTRRVQKITEEDFLREGGWKCCEGICGKDTMAYGFGEGDKITRGEYSLNYKDEFAKLWDSINAKPTPVYSTDTIGKRYISHYESYPWEEGDKVETYRGKPHYIHGNPWCWVYSYKLVEKP